LRRAMKGSSGFVSVFLGLLLWLWPPPPLWAEDQEAEGQWGLAQHLMKGGEYYRAITEYKRFLYYFPESSRAELARLRIVEAYVRGQWWADGVKAARELLQRGVSGEVEARVLFLMGVCQARLGLLGDARESLARVLQVTEDADLKGRAEYLIGETHALQGDWDEAIRVLESLGSESSLSQRGWQRAHRIKGMTPPAGKSPWVAGALAAVLPGAGHLYAGRYLDSALAFSVNAAFISATAEAIRKDNPPLAGGLAAVELVWYAGNIFSAVGSAHKYNRSLERQLLEEIRLPEGFIEDLPPLRTEERGGVP
jgi:hypothetical protein